MNRKKRLMSSTLSLCVAIILVFCSLPVYADSIAASTAADSGFIKGMDLSSLEAIEDAGGKYYDENNNEIQDIFAYLSGKGVNYVRLRVWNNPTQSFDGGDYCNKAHTIEMAQRIKSAGLKLLIDFHYSDYWADPATQTKPAAWQNLTFDELVGAVYDYTADVLNGLAAVNAYPDMVQVGNEISNGMLWPDGHVDNGQNLADLLNSGIQAVRDTTPADQYAKVMIHVAEGGDKDRFQYFFDRLGEYGVTDYDIIGMSYYPYWHGTPQDVKNNMNNIVSRYGKEVVIAETAYPYTADDLDGYPNSVTQTQIDYVGLPASVANQKLMTEIVFNTAATVNDSMCLGAFYWEPLWLPITGVGAGLGLGNQWENQIVFDDAGKVMDSINAFTFDKTTAAVNNGKHVILYQPEQLKINTGDYASLSEVLPQTINVLRFDGSMDQLPVVWTGEENIDTGAVGEYTLAGTMTGLNPYDGVQLPTPQINVSIRRNLVQNPSFETISGDTHWTINKLAGDAGKLAVGSDSTPKSGVACFHYYDNKDFSVEVTQEVNVAENHSYQMSAWAQGSYSNMDYNNYYLFAKCTVGGQEVVLGRVDMWNSNWRNWNQFTIPNIVVPEGVSKITIGAHVQGTSGAFGTMDDFELMDNDPNAPPVGEPNYLLNSGLDYGTPYASMANWNVSADNNVWPANAWADSNFNHSYGGRYAFHYYDANAFGADLSQTVNNLESGVYRLTVWSYGSNDGKQAALYADSGTSHLQTAITDTNQWDNTLNAPVWQQFTLDNIVVSDGSVKVGADITGAAGSWGYLDDFALNRVGPLPEANSLLNGNLDDGTPSASMANWNVAVDNGIWPAKAWADSDFNHTTGAGYAFHYYDAGSFGIDLSQTVNNLESGVYRLAVWSYGSNDGKQAALYADSGTSHLQTSITDTNQWDSTLNAPVWQQFVLDNIVVSDGSVKVGVDIAGAAGSWGYLDDFVLTRVGSLPDPNLLLNGYLDDGTPYASMANWNVAVDNGVWPDNAWADSTQNHTTTGPGYAFHYYDPDAFGVNLSQTVSNLENGTYMLTVWSYGSNDGKSAGLFADTGSFYRSVPITDTNQWDSTLNAPVWQQFTMDNIYVSNGSITVGADITGLEGSWGYLDDFVLLKVSDSDERPAPVVSFSPGEGSYALPQNIAITATENSAVYYTLDSSDPTTASALYVQPINLTQNTTMKAIAVSALGKQSRIFTQQYIIDARIPAKPTLSNTYGILTETGNGNYTVIMTLVSGNRGTTYKLYENGNLVDTKSLTDNSPLPQIAVTSFTGKNNGTYTYYCELINQYGVTLSGTMSVTVARGEPSKPLLTCLNLNGCSSYTVVMTMLWGTNGTSYKLYENGVLIVTKSLTSFTPFPQGVTTKITGKAPGVYEYRCELINSFGAKSSNTITVNVLQ